MPLVANASPGFPDDAMLCRVDAALLKAEGRGCFVTVLYDVDGRFLDARNGPLRCFNDAYSAEALAVREALSWLNDINVRKVLVDTDSQLVARSIHQHAMDSSIAGCALNDSRDILKFFDFLSIRFINRSLNSIAHTLARDAKFQAFTVTWDLVPPSCILNSVHLI